MQNSVTEFLNVDLDLRAAGGLQELIDALAGTTVVLHASEDHATLELAVQPTCAEDAIIRFAEMVEQLPVNARAAWERCGTRTFNIGIRSGEEPHQAQFALSQMALRRLGAIRAEVVITVYATPIRSHS